MAGQGWVDKLAVQQAGPLGVGREQPQHEGHLDLIVEREPIKAQGAGGQPAWKDQSPAIPHVPGTDQEMKMSVKISTAMKSAKTIQYIIHRT